MRRAILIAAAGMGLVTGGAGAADLGAPVEEFVTAPALSWTGFYLGGHAGYGWSDKDWTLVQNAGRRPSPEIGSVITSHDADGAIGGIQLGYNHQRDRLVLGVEGEFSWTGMDGYSTWRSEDGRFRDASTDINWIMTLAGRIGFTHDRTLFFAKAGVAWADEDFSHTGGSADRVRKFSGDDTRTGWLIGAGLERAIDSNWSLKAEYNYLDFGDEKISLSDGDRTAIFDIDQDAHIVKIGFNYRFDTAPRSVPLK